MGRGSRAWDGSTQRVASGLEEGLQDGPATSTGRQQTASGAMLNLDLLFMLFALNLFMTYQKRV